MDMNELFYHHQIALMDAAHLRGSQRNGGGLVAHYAKRIRAYRARLGLNPYRIMIDGIC